MCFNDFWTRFLSHAFLSLLFLTWKIIHSCFDGLGQLSHFLLVTLLSYSIISLFVIPHLHPFASQLNLNPYYFLSLY